MRNGSVRSYTSGSGVHGAAGSRCRRHVVDGVDGVGDVAQTLLERPLGGSGGLQNATGTAPGLVLALLSLPVL